MKYVIIILLAAGIIALLVLAPSIQEKPQDKAANAVKVWLSDRLDDPDSYKPGKFVIDKNGSGWDVDHEFRAKNKFGALVNDAVRVYVDSAYNVLLPEEMK